MEYKIEHKPPRFERLSSRCSRSRPGGVLHGLSKAPVPAGVRGRRIHLRGNPAQVQHLEEMNTYRTGHGESGEGSRETPAFGSKPCRHYRRRRIGHVGLELH